MNTPQISRINHPPTKSQQDAIVARNLRRTIAIMERKLASVYRRMTKDFKAGQMSLLEIAQHDYYNAIQIARNTVVRTNLKDAKNRVDGLLKDAGCEGNMSRVGRTPQYRGQMIWERGEGLLKVPQSQVDGKSCFRCCLGALLHRHPLSIPNYLKDINEGGAENWLQKYNKWLCDEGYGLGLLCFSAPPLDEYEATFGTLKGYNIALYSGQDTPGGKEAHSVIAKDGRCMWDPDDEAPDDWMYDNAQPVAFVYVTIVDGFHRVWD